MALRVTRLPSSLSFSFLPLSPKKLFSNTHCRRSFCFSTFSMSSDSSSSITHTISLPGQPVEIVASPGITPSEFRNAIESSLFQQWLKNLQGDNGALANGAISLNKVLIQGVDYFGNRIGFLKFKADVIDKELGKKVPGIVFARGPAVAVLILFESEGETYAVLTEQVRIPTGKFVLELPAGMLDENKGELVGTAVREVEEETGIQLMKEDMVELTAFLDPSTGGKVFPSPGGCDEELSVFLYRREVGKDIIEQLQGKKAGLQDHGELIKVHVIPYAQLWRSTADAKVLVAIALYEMAKRDGLLSKS